MAWQQDPQTGEWVMVDEAAPIDWQGIGNAISAGVPAGSGSPMPHDARAMDQGAWEGPGRTDEGYRTGDAGVYPIMSPEMAPDPAPEGGYSHRAVEPLPMRPEDQAGYQNEDLAAQDAWDEDVQARGNIVRYTPEGVFEVDPNTRRIISRRPTMYRVN